MIRRRAGRPAVPAVLGALAAMVLAVPLAAAGLAFAASLDVRAASLAAFTRTHPCPGEVVVTAASGSVAQVTATVPAACAGRELRLAVLEGDVVRLGAAVVPAGGDVVVDVGTVAPAAVTSVRATVGGWSTPATWVTPAGPPPAPYPGAVRGGTDTSVSVDWRITGGTVCAVVVATRTSAGAWVVQIDPTVAPWRGAVTSDFRLSPNSLSLVPTQGPLLQVDGPGGILGQSPRSFEVCAPYRP